MNSLKNIFECFMIFSGPHRVKCLHSLKSVELKVLERLLIWRGLPVNFLVVIMIDSSWFVWLVGHSSVPLRWREIGSEVQEPPRLQTTMNWILLEHQCPCPSMFLSLNVPVPQCLCALMSLSTGKTVLHHHGLRGRRKKLDWNLQLLSTWTNEDSMSSMCSSKAHRDSSEEMKVEWKQIFSFSCSCGTETFFLLLSRRSAVSQWEFWSRPTFLRLSQDVSRVCVPRVSDTSLIVRPVEQTQDSVGVQGPRGVRSPLPAYLHQARGFCSDPAQQDEHTRLCGQTCPSTYRVDTESWAAMLDPQTGTWRQVVPRLQFWSELWIFLIWSQNK